MEISYQFTWTDFTIAAVFVIVVIIFSFYKFYFRRTDGILLDKKLNQERWRKIEELMAFGKEMNYKLAVIEADKLLDNALKQLAYPGETVAERLKVATYQKSKLREVWWAHKVRNHVVHDINYVIKHGEAVKVLSLFKMALKELGAL